MQITGERVVLRDKRRPSDKEIWFRWLNLEEWQYYDEPEAPFEPPSRETLEGMWNYWGSSTPSLYRLCIDTREGRFIGWVVAYGFDPEARSLFIGIDLPEEDTWGKGYGTEALRLWIDHLFRTMELDEIKTATWTGNRRMMRCAVKCGFPEAVRMPHRAALSVRGEPLERAEFSMSRAAWAAQAATNHQ
jgi:RimJ/RimL family protein N-acetyltransferase